MKNKIFASLLALTLALSLTACGSKSDDSAKADTTDDAQTEQPAEPQETVTLNVAASPTPHAEILKQCVPILAEQGIDLQIHEYSDYVVPNTAVEDGDEDANYFQHVPYLDDFNTTRGTHLVSVTGVHIEPMGIYAGKSDSLDNLPDGASVAVPNDATNEGRALLLLEAQGLIKLADDSNLSSTPKDIVENPKNLTFTEVEAATIPSIASEVDLAVINSNYALGAGLNPVEDALALESSDSPYVNVLVCKEGNENNAAIQALADFIAAGEVTLDAVAARCADPAIADDLKYVLATANAMAAGRYQVAYCPSLVRGQGYYTGMVFEITCPQFSGAVAGGGRYDNMVGKFLGTQVPAVGFSIGFERVCGILLEQGYQIPGAKQKIALLYGKDADFTAVLSRAAALRDAYNVTVLPQGKKLGKQLGQLEAAGFAGAAFMDKDEVKVFAAQ